MDPLKRRPSSGARLAFALSAALLSGLKAFLWIAHEAKPRDFDQVWHAANAFLAGRNPYAEVGPGLAFDWPAPLFYPLPAVITVIPLTPLPVAIAGVIFAGIASGAFVWAATRDSLAPAVVITSASAALAAETVQWSPLIGAAFGLPWLAFLLCAKPTVGFAVWIARPTKRATYLILGFLVVSLLLSPGWPAAWLAALRHTSLATPSGTPYLSPIRTLAGAFCATLLFRWKRPEARLVLALACVPQTPLLYETVPLFLVPVSLVEGGVLWLGSWLAALWLIRAGPYETDLDRFTQSAQAISWCMYLPATLMILRRPNTGVLSFDSSDNSRSYHPS
jgi:hypothetical protein